MAGVRWRIKQVQQRSGGPSGIKMKMGAVRMDLSIGMRCSGDGGAFHVELAAEGGIGSGMRNLTAGAEIGILMSVYCANAWVSSG
jgi:alpha-galactosidase/6-phospho-beta-glucosidase family protein